MKREVVRDLILPAYSISVSDLGILVSRLSTLFEEKENTRLSIQIRRKNENFTFDSVDELSACQDIKGKLTDFYIAMGGYSLGRRIRISSGTVFDSRSKVFAEADSEAWCAGAVELTNSFMQTHKLWYSWFVATPAGWILWSAIYISFLASLFLPKGTKIPYTAFFSWLAVVICFSVLWLGKGKLLPSSILRITEEEGILRRRTPELTLLLASASIVLTIIGLIIGK